MAEIKRKKVKSYKKDELITRIKNLTKRGQETSKHVIHLQSKLNTLY